MTQLEIESIEIGDTIIFNNEELLEVIGFNKTDVAKFAVVKNKYRNRAYLDFEYHLITPLYTLKKNNKNMAKIYRTNGKVENIEPKNGTDFSLEELKEAIGGGYIELVPTDTNEYVVCDEEGKLKNMSFNSLATDVYGYCIPGDYFAGDVIVIKKNQIK